MRAADSPHPKARFHQTLNWIATVSFLLFGGGILLYGIEEWLGRRAWDRYRADAQQRGVKLDLADFTTPEVPDAENFAAIPIFQDAFKADDSGQPFIDPFEIPGENNRRDRSRREPLDLSEWQTRFVKAGFLPEASGDPASDVHRALERFEPALAELRSSSKRPKSRFPDRSKRWQELHYPHFRILQSAGVINSVHLRASLAGGDSTAALADWELGLRLVRSLDEEPTMIAGFVRLALRGMVIEAMREGLAAHRWAAPELRTLAADLRKIPDLEEYLFALQSERAFCNMMNDTLLQKHGWIATANPSPHSFLQRAFPAGLVRRGQLRFNRRFDMMATRIDLATGWVAPPPLDNLFSAEREEHAGWWRLLQFTLCYQTLPAVARFEKKSVEAHALIEQARAACALELYRIDQGALPPSLDDLVPALLPVVPTDPWSGKPLRYERSDDGYRLWAIGEDRHDDGGIFDSALPRRKQKD